ncbi:MAG: DsbA family protein, partial [Burkholderiales bacterium]
YTEEAIAAQVFGVPWYAVDGEPFWGQDRLDFVARALEQP